MSAPPASTPTTMPLDSTASAASAQAVGEAVEMIRHGDADVMLAGGSHSMIHPLGVTGFNRLTALSTRNDAPQKASRPFDLHRDGFVLGEGAWMVVLEREDRARARGATLYASIDGYGSTCDAYHRVQMAPAGDEIVRAMTLAIEPMVNAGKPGSRVKADRWTAVTEDDKYSAHFEHTVAITANGPWVLTRP